ncbi:MAG: hypothetical protein M0Q13_04990 [Methanothrix sp.]|jgi:hypothetical protein|nr:hypothetical protein [Methanothrix sp.]
MEIQNTVLWLFIFAILVGIMTVEGGDVKYTFDKEVVAAKNAANSAAPANEIENSYIKTTTT